MSNDTKTADDNKNLTIQTLSVEEYEKIFNTIHELSIEKQAEYADEICAQFCADPEFSNIQLIQGEQDPQFELWNTCSIGNVARMVLLGPKNHHQRWKAVLDRYFEYRSRRNQSFLSRLLPTDWPRVAVLAVIIPVALYIHYQIGKHVQK